MDQIQAAGKAVGAVNSTADLKTSFSQFKKVLFKQGLLVLTSSQLSPQNPQYNDLIAKLQAVVAVFEEFCVAATKLGDPDLFNQVFTLLSPYYIDSDQIFQSSTPSSNRPNIIATRLLSFLIDAKESSTSLQQFHCLVQYLTRIERNNELIAAVLSLEQSLMQGAYSKLLTSPQIQLLNEKIPGITALTSQLRTIVLAKVAYSLERSSSEYKIEQIKTVYKLSQNDVDAMVAKNGWRVDTTTGVVVFTKNADSDNMVDEATQQQIELKEIKARNNNFIGELIKIAKQSEKIV